jgi:cytochrome c biogenesis protein CcdA
MWFELLALIIGVTFGYIRRGKEDQVVLIKQGLVIGVIIGFILGILSIFTPSGMSIRAEIEGAVGITVRAIILALIFVIGVMIGDYFEMLKKNESREGISPDASLISLYYPGEEGVTDPSQFNRYRTKM